MVAMRLLAPIALMVLLLVGCSVNIDTGSDESKPKRTGDPAVQRLEEYDAREKARECVECGRKLPRSPTPSDAPT